MRLLSRVLLLLILSLGISTPARADLGCPSVSGCRLVKQIVHVDVYPDGTNVWWVECTYRC